MMTVKVVSGEREELFEAVSVQKEINGIVCHQGNETVFIGPGGARLSPVNPFDEIGQPQTAQAAQQAEALKVQYTSTAYVMNRFGATVATYRL